MDLAARRLRSPSLLKTVSRWSWMVCGLMASALAKRRVDQPAGTKVTMSRSLGPVPVEDEPRGC